MNKSALILIAVFFTLSAQAQYHFDLYSVPDSAAVFINGDETCTTPCRVKFYWKDNVDGKIIFTVKAPGRETWSDTLFEKPFRFDFQKTAILKHEVSKLKLDSITPVIGFDKLITEFEEGTKIGTFQKSKKEIQTLKWINSYKIGDDSFTQKFYDVLSEQGFQTPFNGKIVLFKNDQDKIRLPRYLVGAKITEFKLQLEKTKDLEGDHQIKGFTVMGVDWKVLDKKTNKVVLTYSNKNMLHYRLSHYNRYPDNSLVFEEALYEFLRNSEFYELVNSSEVSIDYAMIGDSASNIQRAITIPTIPEFEKLSDMIKYANPACVTIITDGGFGSGVVINSEGYVLSAYHVVESVNQIDVKFSNGLTLNADIIAYDYANDIVLLDINGSGFPALPVSIGTEVPLGEEVITIGTPASIDLGQSIAKGLISGKRLIEDRVYLQADIAVSPGNSGGPLLNAQGEIIGIVQSKIVTEGVEGIGFALPMEKALEMLNLRVKVE
ncbi:serine protease [Cryomorpha ignava]|uniref:Serine protease n=1 Tax=Cryomorpha ignava TaxID=101383 RepID=A0A7K3WPV9_9FLAO|nr:S1C family serine protease [Cryomorpha ignava]NEN23524.1 serine protease [Cryomorpha ignava]